MKLNKIMLAAAMAFGATSFAHAADQGHGKVNFIGSIIDAPCSIAPESLDQTVDLGQVSNVALKTAALPIRVRLISSWSSAISPR